MIIPVVNKKQIRLKTVVATNWIDPKEQILRKAPPSSIRQSPKRNSTVLVNRKIRTLTERREEDEGIFHKIVSKNMQEGRVSLGGKTNLQKFPKRQSMVKNGNPYRYFLNSKKVLTEVSEPQHQFMIKMNQAIQHSHSKRLSLRRHTTQSCHQKTRKTTDTVFKQVKTARPKRWEEYNHAPGPWALREEYQQCHFG